MTCRCFSAEFAYCEADITFFAARHNEDTRQWLFEDFDKWFSDPGDSRAYVLLGDAGIGKSVIAGALTQRARNKGNLGGAYFCRHNDGTRNNPRYLVGTIARQLCDCNSEISTLVGGEDGVKMMLADSKLGVKELFTKLLEEPLGMCAPCQRRKLVIIDALDETEYESREDFLYVIKKALPRLPQWLLFFITSRPEDSVQSRLEKYKPCIRICAGDSDEQGFYQQHEQDIQLFLRKEVDFSYLSYSFEQVTKKCNGLFLYAYYIAEVLKESNSHRVSQQTDLFPGDIDEFFQENFQRVFDKIGEDLYRKLFGCIIAAPSPLPISFISYILNREKSNFDQQKAIDAVSLFVVRTSDATVKFLHNLIPMWLTDKKKAPRRLLIDEKVAVEYLRMMFIEIISTVVEETRATDLERFVMHFAVRFQCHHVDQNSLTNVFNWLTNYRFLEKRIHSGRSEIYHVIEDLKLASSCLPAEEIQQRNVLQEISSALESDFHVLVECPHLLRSCFRNTLDGAGEIFSISQVSAPCLEWNICDISAAKTLYQCNCFATTSDKKIFAGAKGRSLFFFDASTLETLGGPFEVSRDVIQRINCLEFSPDDKFVFFGRLDKWFSVGRSCVKDFRQFSENPGHHYWGRILSNGQHMVVKRNHFSDLPETCETKRCIEDILSLWALKEIDGGPDKEWTCSFRQLPEMVAGFSTMGIETSSLLRRLGTNLMSCEVDAMHGANYRSCYFCDQLKELKELTDPSKETSLKHVRQLIIKLYRWIFRYQVWNLETGRPLLQDVFNQCVQFNPFTYFCHVTSAFDKWGKDIGCGGVDQVMSVCNIAVVTAIDTFFRLRVDWSKRPYVRLIEREMEWLREFLEGLRSLKCTETRDWVFKETHEETLKQDDWKEEGKKLTQIVWWSLEFISKRELRIVRAMVERELIEMVKRGLKEVWKLKVDFPGEVEWRPDKMMVRMLKKLWNLKENLPGEWDLSEMVERRLNEVLKLKEDLHGEEEKKLIEMLGERLMEVWKLEEDLHGEEEKKLIEMVERGLKEVWKPKEELHGKEERKLIEMVENRLKEVWKLEEELHGKEEKKSIELVEKRLKEVSKLKEELHGEEEKTLIEMVEKRLKEVWKLEEELHGEEEKKSIEMVEKRLKEVWKLEKELHGEEEKKLIEAVEKRLKVVRKLKVDLHGEEKKLIEMLGKRLKVVWKPKEVLNGKEMKKLIEMVERGLKEVWKLKEELNGKEERKLIEMVEKRLKEVWKLEEELHGEEENKSIELVEKRLKEVWKLKEELQGEEEKKLIEMVEKRLKEVWKLKEELHGKEEMKLGEMAEKRLKEVWKLEEEFHGEEEVTEKIEKMLKEEWKLAEKLKRIGEKEKKAIEQVEENLKDVWELKEQLHAEEEKRLIEMVEKRLKEVWKLKEELHGEEKKLIEMVEKRLKEVWKLKEELHGEEEKKSIELVEKRLKEVWKLKEELQGEEEKKLIEMVEKRLKEFLKSEEELHGEEKKKLIEMVEKRLKEVWKSEEELHGEEEKKLIEMVEKRLKEVWKLEEDLHGEEEKKLIEMLGRRLKVVCKPKEELHGKEEKNLTEMVERGLKEVCKRKKELYGKVELKAMGLKEDLCQMLDELFSGLWQLICEWTLQLDLELFCDSFKRDVFLNFPKAFLDLVGNDISHCLSPRKMWMANSRMMEEIHLRRTSFQDQDSYDYSSEKQEYRFTQTKYLTFTYDDLYVVFLSHEKLLHALSLQTGTIFTSVSGRNCCYFTRERRVGYLFRSGTEERAIFLSSLLNPCKFFSVLPGQDGEVGETTAAIFSSSDTVKSISSESLITSWRLLDHNLGFSFERFSESSSAGSRSQVIKIQNCVFSIDGKLLAFQQHTQIKQCLVEDFEKSQCIVFEADLSVTDLCLTFSLDGVFLLFSIRDNCSGQHFYVWHVQEKVLSKSFSSPCLLSIDSFCLSSDNRNLILCGDEYEIEIWEFSLYPLHLLKRICVERSFNPVKFSHCAVSQDTELLVCCLANVIFVYSLQVADIHSSKRVLRGHVGKIEFCKFLKRNRYLISYAVDGMVFLWDISESKAIGFARIAKGREKIVCVAVSPDEDRAVCFISPSRVCVLNFCNLKCALPVDFFTAPRKGGISTAETSLLPFRQISASLLDNIQPGGFSNPDLEEQFFLTQDDFLDSDESDESVNQDDFD